MKLHLNRRYHPESQEALMTIILAFKTLLSRKERRRMIRLAKQFDGQRDEIVLTGFDRDFLEQVADNFATKAEEERKKFFSHKNFFVNLWRKLRYWRQEKLAARRCRALHRMHRLIVDKKGGAA